MSNATMLLNFREVSGMIGHQGRRIRPGSLFRGGAVSTQHGAANIRELGVSLICDLRARHEETRSPSALRACGMYHPVENHDIDVAAPLRMLRKQGATAAESRAAMVRIYDRLPDDFRPVLRSVFKVLASAGRPAYVHCAIGKDRTGITVALLLAGLGVSRADIMRDYLATNDAFDDIARHVGLRDGDPHAEIAAATVPLLIADEAYLDSFLAGVGDPGQYLRSALELTDSEIAGLRDRFLT